jgi:hypothetical protein
MKFTGFLAAVAGVVGFTAISAQAAPVFLDLTVTPTGASTWSAFATITGDTARTLGLSGAEFSVVGSGGVVVTGSTVRLPQAFPPDSFGDPFPTGFTQFRSNGAAGVNIRAAQNSVAYATSDNGNSNLISGVGLFAGSQSGNTWAFPVLVATGTYTGAAGFLTIVGNPANTNFLPAQLPPGGTGNVATFSPDGVNGQTTPVGIPEPASVGVLALGGLALLARRRKAC